MIKAYAAESAGGILKPFEYQAKDLQPLDVEIDVKHCGVCHSDLSMWRNDWGITQYPFVGGHEVAGIVSSVGSLVSNVNVGDPVGLGWHKGYCNNCFQCLSGDHNLCAQSEGTIVGHYGGFANKVRAQATSVIKLPDSLPLSDVGPLLCGGITVFNPLIQYDIKPTSHVAVIGIGGLGHLALQFAKAWGCEVTALTSESKMDEAKKMGAHHCLNSRDEKALANAVGTFDLIISTVNVTMGWNTLLMTLKSKGRLHLLGIPQEPMHVQAFNLLAEQRSISASPVGSPATLQTMLAFSARHQIRPVTQHFPLSKINEAFAHLASGDARYRIVLDC